MSESPLWTTLAADGSVEPIRIVDLDVAKTTWSRVHESMRVVHLRLNRQPDLQWVKFFHEERESRIGIRRRGLWIEDGYIAFDCLTSEIESYHLPDIRRSVEVANRQYAEFVDARQRERSADRAAGRNEIAELEILRQRLRAGVEPTAPAPDERAVPVVALPKAPEVEAPSPPERIVDERTARHHDEAASAARAEPARRLATDGLEHSLAEFRTALRKARSKSTRDDKKS